MESRHRFRSRSGWVGFALRLPGGPERSERDAERQQPGAAFFVVESRIQPIPECKQATACILLGKGLSLSNHPRKRRPSFQTPSGGLGMGECGRSLVGMFGGSMAPMRIHVHQPSWSPTVVPKDCK